MRRRQQQVIVALVRKWLDPGLVELMADGRGCSAPSRPTSPSTSSPTLLEIGRRSASAEVTGIVLEPPRFSLFVGFEPNSPRGWVMIPDVPEIQRLRQVGPRRLIGPNWPDGQAVRLPRTSAGQRRGARRQAR